VLRKRHAAGIAAVLGVTGAMVSAPAIASQQVTASATSAKVAPVHITVTATEFRFKLSKTTVKHGTTVIFKLVNAGVVAHDFSFTTLHKKTPIIASKKTSTLTIKFTKKGKFKYICSVPRHAEQGMTGFFKVT
jgi:plastocyanin